MTLTGRSKNALVTVQPPEVQAAKELAKWPPVTIVSDTQPRPGQRSGGEVRQSEEHSVANGQLPLVTTAPFPLL